MIPGTSPTDLRSSPGGGFPFQFLHQLFQMIALGTKYGTTKMAGDFRPIILVNHALQLPNPQQYQRPQNPGKIAPTMESHQLGFGKHR